MWAMVLAGGSSRRMGRRKQDLPIGGGTLLECVVAAARQAAEEVVLLGEPGEAERLGLRWAADHVPGAGPLAGLAGGLAVAPEGIHALLGCDLPFLHPELLRRMRALAGDADAVVPVHGGRWHPLCALYRRDCLRPARECLAEGRRRMDDLLSRVRVRAVHAAEMAPLSLERCLTNVNTPEDYQRALRGVEIAADEL